MGNKRLIVDQADYLTAMGHEVHFLFVDVSLRKRPEKYKLMNEYWGNRLHILHTSLLRKILFNLRLQTALRLHNGNISTDCLYFNQVDHEINRLDADEHFDCCIVNYFYLSKALEKISIPRRALLTHDIFADRSKDSQCSVMSTTPDEELKAALRSPIILTVQESDADYFKRLSPKSKVLSTFSTFDYYPSEIAGTANVLYLSGNALFNIIGLDWLFENVWPEVRKRKPEAKLIIGGGICSALKDKVIPEGVELKGYITDVAKFYASGDIFVNPTYLGTGLKIKTLESVARDKVSITRSHNRIGLPYSDEMPIIFSDSPEEWVDFICLTLENQAKIAEIKRKNQSYLTLLNNHIRSQYEQLLS